MPNNSVGGVSVSVRLDDKEAMAQLDKLRRKIDDTQRSLSEKKEKRDSIENQMRVAGAEADRALAKVEQHGYAREGKGRQQP